MNRVFIVVVFILLVCACEEREVQDPQVPEWLQPRVTELENSGECFGCTLRRITFQDRFYFHIYCSYWSCSHCEVYEEDGTLVDWKKMDFNEFLTEQTSPVILWECAKSTD